MSNETPPVLLRDGKPWRFSATQLGLVMDCQAAYGFKYVDGLPSSASPWLAFGVRAHSLAEGAIVRDESIPTDSAEGRAAVALVAALPDDVPRGELVVEGNDEWHAPNGFTYVIRRDLYRADEELPFVGDFKTTSDARKWAKTATDLLTDPQAMLYAADALARNPSARGARLRWMSVERKGALPRVAVADVTVTRNHVDEQFARLSVATTTAADIISNRTPGRALPMAGGDACSKYGGCPYRHVCPEGSRVNLFGGPVMATAPAITHAWNPPAVDVVPVGVRGMKGYPFPPGTFVVDAQGNPGQVNADGSVTLAMKFGVVSMPAGQEELLTVSPPHGAPGATPGQVNPPESTPNTTLEQSAATYVGVIRTEKNATPDTSELAAAVEAAVEAAAAATPAPEEKPKRGRPKKAPAEAPPAPAATAPAFPPGTWVSEVSTGLVGVVQDDGRVWLNRAPAGQTKAFGAVVPTAGAFVAVPAPETAAPSEAPAPAPSKSLLVLVDAYFAVGGVAGKAVPYSDLYEKALEKFEAETKVSDPESIEFGKGKPLFRQCLDAAIRGAGPCAVTISSGAPFAADFLMLAAKHGATIIRGAR